MKNHFPDMLCFVLGVILGAAMAYLLFGKKPRIETKTEWKTDTMFVEKKDTAPEKNMKSEKVLKYIYLGGDTIHDTDTVRLRDSIPVPITQKEYEDTSYHVWVSGYLPSLDSIFVRERTVTNTLKITNTVNNKWNVGVVGGYGYGFRSKQLEPFFGVGVSYNIDIRLRGR